MRKTRALLALISVFFFPFFTKGQDAPNKLDDLSWYKMLTGKIGTYPITMHLHKAGHGYRGYYYYNSTQQPIYFSGDDTFYDGKIVIGCYQGESLAETFDFLFSGDSAIGLWKQNETDKSLRFAVGEAKMPAPLTYIYTKGTKQFRPGIDESPIANFERSSVWPVGHSPTDELIKKVIREVVDKDYNGNDEIGPIFLALKKEFFKFYMDENTDIPDDDMPGYLNWENQEDLLVYYYTPSFICLSSTGYYYTGGAHGNFGTLYRVISLMESKQLILDDVLTAKGQETLGGLLEKKFRKQYEVKDSETLQDGGLFGDKIEPNDNFYLTGRGIGFVYNPYEIGPYVLGEIDLFIPFSELVEGLKPEMKMLLE